MREPDHPQGLPSALLRMLEDPGSATLSKLWSALEVGQRAATILEALRSDEEPQVRSWAVGAAAGHRNFRRETVRGWDDSKLARIAALPRTTSMEVLPLLLRVHHLHEKGDLLGAYLTEMGVPHEGGLAVGDVPDDLEADDARDAAASLPDRFPVRDVVLYLLTLRLLTPALVPALDEWLPDLLDGPSEGPEAEEVDEPLEPGRPASLPERTDEFTTLDVQMVRTIVDVAQGVEGALDPDALEDLVEELISLNSARHRSYFHLGFSDVVLERGVRADLPAKNESRLLWYWSGRVSGLARTDRWGDIVEAFDEPTPVRQLGGSASGACSTAAPLIFDALVQANRSAEAARFLSDDALIENVPLAEKVHAHARDLMWEDRADEARALMDLLGRVVRRLEMGGVPSTHRFLLEVRRRRAHCFRQLGELTQARRILERLLEEEPKADVRSMVLTDLGLLEGGFRSLAHVGLPEDEDKRGDVIAALERGEPLFRQSTAIDALHAVHGRYCIGVLALLRKEWDEAARELEPALSVFASEADRYRSGQLLSRTRLYLGLALALSLDVVRTEKAAELIESALEDGVTIPPYLTTDALEALHMSGSEDAAQDLAELLLDSQAAQLDELAASEVARKTPAIARALVERADRSSRSRASRAADLRCALPLFLEQGMVGEAAALLDSLETAAKDGVGADELLDILADPGAHEPAWEGEEVLWARIGLLGREGRRGEAVPLLEEEFWRVLYGDGFGFLEQAESLLEMLEEYGADEEKLQSLRTALDDRQPEEETEDELVLDRRVRILFVGGDERQAAHDDAIREDLHASHPRISVEFEHPGWSGHWGPGLENLKQRLPRYDAVVVMRFIRTEYGKQLRKALEVPWAGCHGQGRQRMKRSILMAARMARSSEESDAA